MISYTVTTQKTQGEYIYRRTENVQQTAIEHNWSTYTTPDATYTFKDILNVFGLGSFTQKGTSELFTDSNGGESYSTQNENTWTIDSEIAEGGKGSISFYSYSKTVNSNLAATETYSSSYRATYEGDFEEAGGKENFTTLTPTTISEQTSTASNQQLHIRTTKTVSFQQTIIGTTVPNTITEGTVTKFGTEILASTTITVVDYTAGEWTFIDRSTTVTTTKQIDTAFVTFDNNRYPPSDTRWDSKGTGVRLPPRDTATIFCNMQNEAVWVPSATGLSGAGPWALTDIASSQTSDFTALPFYSTSPLFVTDESLNTFPELILTTVTEAYTTLTYDISNPVTRTIWRSNQTSGFPLESYTQALNTFTTTAVENIFEIEKESQVNQALTEAATEIGTELSVSAAGKNFGLTYQDIYSHSYTTTRYRGIYSFTSSTQYEGLSVDTEAIDGTTKSTFYQNVSVNLSEGMTVVGTNFEQIVIRNFSPCVVSHVETSFADAWGIYGSSGPEPKAKIEFSGSLSLSNSTQFAELLPGVSVPFPGTYSWSTGNSTLSASLAGNAITISTTSGTGSNASTDSETYEFEGDGTARTEQISGRDFFVNSRGLPPISFFGPHAASGSVETRALPGEYVSITQDSLGAFTLSTLTHETTSASIISDNAILFPGEKSFYTTTGGVPYLTFSRNPIP